MDTVHSDEKINHSIELVVVVKYFEIDVSFEVIEFEFILFFL